MSTWTVIYYHNRKGERLVFQEIADFGLSNQAKITIVIGMLADYGFQMPGRYVKHIQNKLWELRIDRFRVLYVAYTNHQFVLLRAFLKKTTKTPRSEVNIALKRLEDYNERTQENNDENQK